MTTDLNEKISAKLYELYKKYTSISLVVKKLIPVNETKLLKEPYISNSVLAYGRNGGCGLRVNMSKIFLFDKFYFRCIIKHI